MEHICERALYNDDDNDDGPVLKSNEHSIFYTTRISVYFIRGIHVYFIRLLLHTGPESVSRLRSKPLKPYRSFFARICMKYRKNLPVSEQATTCLLVPHCVYASALGP